MTSGAVAVLKVADLRKLASFPLDALSQQIGPLALIQRPAEELLEQAAMKQAMAVTVPMATKPKIAAHVLSLMLRFEEMVVVPVGATASTGEMVLGRSPDCDVLVGDASVSSYHATLRWDAWKRAAWLRDMDSTNGTFVNGKAVGSVEVALKESDSVSLGDAAFLLVRVETLHAMLRQQGPR